MLKEFAHMFCRAIMGAGLGNSTALITDGRFSGASRGFIIGMLSLPFLSVQMTVVPSPNLLLCA